MKKAGIETRKVAAWQGWGEPDPSSTASSQREGCVVAGYNQPVADVASAYQATGLKMDDYLRLQPPASASPEVTPGRGPMPLDIRKIRRWIETDCESVADA